ncbi:hypothetical protein SAVERM_686 [Streptomyces avermitilis MA-4680 = NBRC 14893]|uniref:Uncharacterized protein n=1 Tax=Streptomyces avermitilis (strain ATCC 31267 / DSM 46492 / JCM 5070 / NBRC 14893 / NCIMB 12804 / NRRL 8165 / MA-4680) TaxID=227882 RepID=Q82Q35_STRAW|nr:hypothetical protein SAVERM_686 [Streptomyces avermitilis MA-4680 = NBRC 14893]
MSLLLQRPPAPSTRACSFNNGTWAPKQITLPEDLLTVPATGEAGHGTGRTGGSSTSPAGSVRSLTALAPARNTSGPVLRWEGRELARLA